MRLAVYTPYTHQRRGDRIFAERAFALFLDDLEPRFERFVVLGRLGKAEGEARYPVSAGTEFVELPYFESLARPLRALPAILRSLLTFARTLRGVDAVWVLGPNPLAVAFASMALASGRRVFLCVRQDTREYMRTRHPDRRSLQLLGAALEGCFRLLARRAPTVAVGPELAEGYRRAGGEVLEVAVSLVREADVRDPSEAIASAPGNPRRALSVGRLEAEKNPLLLADVIAGLNSGPERWILEVCGEGGMRDDLVARLAALGQGEHAKLRGYVPFGAELRTLYERSDVLIHVSWTEGMPQVLLEAFAAGLPAVATNVGGVSALGDAVSLVEPGDADAVRAAAQQLVDDEPLRAARIAAGFGWVGGRTLERESERVHQFITARSRAAVSDANGESAV